MVIRKVVLMVKMVENPCHLIPFYANFLEGCMTLIMVRGVGDYQSSNHDTPFTENFENLKVIKNSHKIHGLKQNALRNPCDIR
jgi:hypothetical protein